MKKNEIDQMLNDLEDTHEKPDFFQKVESFNKTFVENFQKKDAEIKEFPFGSEMPLALPMNFSQYPVVHTIYYIPYFPPRTKEIYPYEKEETDLKHWKNKRKEYKKYLKSFT